MRQLSGAAYSNLVEKQRGLCSKPSIETFREGVTRFIAFFIRTCNPNFVLGTCTLCTKLVVVAIIDL